MKENSLKEIKHTTINREKFDLIIVKHFTEHTKLKNLERFEYFKIS